MSGRLVPPLGPRAGGLGDPRALPESIVYYSTV